MWAVRGTWDFNVFKEGELNENVVCREFRHTTPHGAIKGKTQETSAKYYNLDVIISVGYRVKSRQGTQFRQWATQRLKDYLVQGYAITEHRLAQKQQEVQTLKDGIRILSRVIEDKATDLDFPWLHYFAKGLELDDEEAVYKINLQGLFDLSYDQFLEFTEREIRIAGTILGNMGSYTSKSLKF